MYVSCGQELCKNCKGCHNEERERYIQPSDTCGIKRREEGAHEDRDGIAI